MVTFLETKFLTGYRGSALYDCNNSILISSGVIARAADVNLPDAEQDFTISAHLWAKVDPLPDNLKFSINVNMGKMLSDNWPSLRKLGSDGPWPQQLNRGILVSKVRENNYNIEAAFSKDSGVTTSYGRKNEEGLNFTTDEWKLTVNSSRTGLSWRYNYFDYSLCKNLNDRRSFAPPGGHSCHWIMMDGFHIIISQVLRCTITNSWRKLKLNTGSKLIQLCPKMSHTLKITFKSLENFNEGFEKFGTSKKNLQDLLNVTLEKGAKPQMDNPKNLSIGNINIERSVL
ncbi:hypothetical protein Glove_658g7 [Diversispora epigaea]|uniref:Uncharacterized protein n=1 Tax=Diversispora epigaea TaxID=1348612 RepID=A0A397G6T5_9GLOM|nr:hypothetical protein Glove_658g7 [Diversispora epigaea]